MLTKYKEGSIGELWTVSFPLMITIMSSLTMLFVDRCFLAYYSSDALNASVNAASLGWSFLIGVGIITGIAQIFVAQYNGAEKFKDVSRPVWQMIYLAVFSVVIFIPLGIWGAEYFFYGFRYKRMASDYFRWMMMLAPFFAIHSALASFYIGRGKTKIITALSVFANIVNIGLDYIFIFGWKDYFPSLGVKGAAIATGMGGVFLSVSLFWMFLRKDNAIKYGTHNYSFDYKIFMSCLKVGVPSGISVMVEIVGWSLFYRMLTNLGEIPITVASICQSLFILIFFFTEGIGKGASVIAGNRIGAGRTDSIVSILYAGVKLNIIFIIFLLSAWFLWSEFLVDLFIQHSLPDSWELSDIELLAKLTRSCLLLTIFYVFWENLRFVVTGLLTAAGDTRFIMYICTLSSWLFFLLPVYFFVVKGYPSIELAYIIMILYAFILAAIFIVRFLKSQKLVKVLVD